VPSLQIAWRARDDSAVRLSGRGHEPWHFLYFLPLPHGQGSFLPTLGSSRLNVLMTSSPPVRAGTGPLPPAMPVMSSRAGACDRLAANGGIDSAPGLFVVIEVGRRARATVGTAGASSFI